MEGRERGKRERDGWMEGRNEGMEGIREGGRKGERGRAKFDI